MIHGYFYLDRKHLTTGGNYNMINNTFPSDLQVALFGRRSELDENSRKKIEDTFYSLFEDQATLVSDTHDYAEQVDELIYNIRTPIIQDDEMMRDFFSNLEILFEELTENRPYFTNYSKKVLKK